MVMPFEKYRRLRHRDRALVDGRLITYHFYVGGITLLVLGVVQVLRSEPFAIVALFFGAASLALGVGLHLFHYYMIRSPHKQEYLVTISAALGRQRFPLVPTLLSIIVVFSALVMVLFISAG
ncbi:MAG: hypothetical protein P1P84_10780 [Deferrisomatales bacterium]|nr:hypothetical protein [Deferrisomatales bacterium]